KLPMLLPGITVSTAADDYAPIKQMQLEKFDGTTWKISADAKCRLEDTEVRADTIKNSLNKARRWRLPAQYRTRRIGRHLCVAEQAMMLMRHRFHEFTNPKHRFDTWGNSGLEPSSGSGNQLSTNTRPTSWGLAIMEGCNGALCRTGHIVETDCDLHRRSNRK